MAADIKYTSVKRIVENFYRSYGFKDKLQFGDVIEYVADAIDLIGIPIAYKERITNDVDESVVEVDDYRGTLPCDCLRIKQIRDYDTKVVYVANSNTFHKSASTGYDDTNFSNYTYKVEYPYIYTNNEECNLEIVYDAFLTDSEGYPMVPDDVMYLKAVVAYLGERIGFKCYIEGSLDKDKYDLLSREWMFYVNSAATKSRIPTLDEMESLKNQLCRMIKNPKAHSRGFVDNSETENFKA